jgi:hypothetical protein
LCAQSSFFVPNTELRPEDFRACLNRLINDLGYVLGTAEYIYHIDLPWYRKKIRVAIDIQDFSMTRVNGNYIVTAVHEELCDVMAVPKWLR